MSATRQQRTSRVRSVVTRAVPAYVPDITWGAFPGDDGQLQILLDANPEGLSLTGIPQVRVQPTGNFPIAAELRGRELWLTYGGSLDSLNEVQYPQRDPAVRSAQGAYVVGFNEAFSPPPPTSDWDANVADANTITVRPQITGTVWALGNPNGWLTVPGGDSPNSWAQVGDFIQLVYGPDISSNTGLAHVGFVDQNIELSGQRLREQEKTFA